MHAWYVYLHLVKVYGKCRELYQSHGCVMGLFWRKLERGNAFDTAAVGVGVMEWLLQLSKRSVAVTLLAFC